MNANEILDRVNTAGGKVTVDRDRLRIEIPRGRLGPELQLALSKHKGEIISLLNAQRAPERHTSSTDRTNRTFLQFEKMRLQDLAKLDVALRIESRLVGEFWLVSNERLRRQLDQDGVVYTAEEAMLILGLPPGDIKKIHGFKKEFGGTLGDLQKSGA